MFSRSIIGRVANKTSTTMWAAMTNSEIKDAVRDKKIASHGLEQLLAPDYERAIEIRRELLKEKVTCSNSSTQHTLDTIPFKDYPWHRVVGQNCENIIGYLQVPLGFAGPLVVDGEEVAIPMATTEGALVASTNRGAHAINQSGGCTTAVLKEGMTRAPVIEATTLEEAVSIYHFCTEHFDELKRAFESTTSFGKLLSIKPVIAGRTVHLRFTAFTADAMGMNMITKGCDKALEVLKERYSDIKVLALSGNYCTDKKSAAVNWIEGRGKSIVAEAVIKEDIVAKVLKTNVDALVSLNVEKNLIGSALAGALGGYNAHAANVVAAIFLATGQDPAQVIESAACITTMCKINNDLVISVTMPSIEVGTVGGGTGLPVQRASLDLVGCGGACKDNPGLHSRQLARVIAAAVLCGELSLMSGLASNALLTAHLKLNRKPTSD